MKRYGVLFLFGIAGSLMAMESSEEYKIPDYMEDYGIFRSMVYSDTPCTYRRPKSPNKKGQFTLNDIQELKDSLWHKIHTDALIKEIYRIRKGRHSDAIHRLMLLDFGTR